MHLPPPGARVEHSSRSRAGIGHIPASGAPLQLTYLQKWREGQGGVGSKARTVSWKLLEAHRRAS